MDFDQISTIVRTYKNGQGEPAPYDVNGVIHLMLAALDNLIEHQIPADWEQVAAAVSPQQKQMLIALGTHLASSPVDSDF